MPQVRASYGGEGPLGQMEISRERSTTVVMHRSLGAIRWLLPVVVLAMAGALLVRIYQHGRQTVWLEINGMRIAHQTREQSPEAVLAELELPLEPEDHVELPLTEDLLENEPIRIHLARQAIVNHDGHITIGLVKAPDIAGMLEELAIVVDPLDRVYVQDQALALQAGLPLPAGNP